MIDRTCPYAAEDDDGNRIDHPALVGEQQILEQHHPSPPELSCPSASRQLRQQSDRVSKRPETSWHPDESKIGEMLHLQQRYVELQASVPVERKAQPALAFRFSARS